MASSQLTPEARELLLDTLGEEGSSAAHATATRAYLRSVTVSGFRGIGDTARLDLSPAPGVTLIVGRNGSGKSSFAEAVEIALTGDNARWRDRSAVWTRNWRNLHWNGKSKVAVEMCLDGDAGTTTLRRSWDGDGVNDSRTELFRPGRAQGTVADLGWEKALALYRPFLSYAELGQIITGRPTEAYDAVARILGLEQLTDAAKRLKTAWKEHDTALKEVDTELESLRAVLGELDDSRASAALAALDGGTPHLDRIADLVSGTPEADGQEIARLRRVAEQLTGPDLAAVETAVARLREAIAVLEDVRDSDAEAAHRRAELLKRALAHAEQHSEPLDCPVCGARGRLDEEWFTRATDEVEMLRREAAMARKAREELTDATEALRFLITSAPDWLPESLTDPWREWTFCRQLVDPVELANRAEQAARVLSDACLALRDEAIKRLADQDGQWREVCARLGGWLHRKRTAEAGRDQKNRLKQAHDWLKATTDELRAERWRPFADQTQQIWNELRQQSNVSLESIRLSGAAHMRKIAMDVAVDGREASALSVMSQGELHSLALALFLPRATAEESPFNFVVIDDPVQSMDPAKVGGLAKVLHGLGRTRQVVVFTHDTRLPRAFRDQGLPVTVLKVERGDDSVVAVETETDPVRQVLKDASDLVRTPRLSDEDKRGVLPGICRTALETAFTESARRRLYADGCTEEDVEKLIRDAGPVVNLAALALFGTDTTELFKDSDYKTRVYRQLGHRCGQSVRETVSDCNRAAHEGLEPTVNPRTFVRRVKTAAEAVRAL
ncbi:ATP-binding protein [Streptomyces macrosporus]|uniref:Nuclease SbcCD subunit C n=1 Tax=Streptomyces macrosporus TaxID=44032 RepID=A0ABN3JXW4_9ACTN